MRTTISISVSPQEAVRTRGLASKRGFTTVSDYIRFLLVSDDEELISEDEILRRSKDVEALHASGGLITAASMSELLK